jgi:hypothetical protein
MGLDAADEELIRLLVPLGLTAAVSNQVRKPFQLDQGYELPRQVGQHHGISAGIVDHRGRNRPNPPLRDLIVLAHKLM